jgi:hypothetical protein
MRREERAMRSISMLLVWAALAAVTTACQGPSIPTSVQKGATFLLPLGSVVDADAGLIGYGSSVYTDRQRGALVVRLDGASGPELVTRAVTALTGPMASPHGFATPFGTRTELVVAMLDVPNRPEISEGVHSLHLTRRRGGVEEPGPSWPGTIAILPASLVAGGDTVVGTPTPFALLDFGGLDATSMIAGAVPEPQVVFPVEAAARAVELELTYPASQIDVRDVTEALVYDDALALPDFAASGVSQSHRALSWWRVSTPGVVTVGMLHPDRALRGVSFVFRLKAAATVPLAATAVQVRNVRAWDDAGANVALAFAPAWIR